MSVTRSLPVIRESPRSLPVALFAVYLALLVWVVLWKLGVPYLGTGEQRAVKLVPFVAGDGYGVSTGFEMLANVALFVPFGVYAGLVAPRWSWLRVAGAAVLTSLALEVTQYVLAVGSSDITDVILNTAGAVAGLLLLAALRRTLRERTGAVVVHWCAMATVAALLAVALA